MAWDYHVVKRRQTAGVMQKVRGEKEHMLGDTVWRLMTGEAATVKSSQMVGVMHRTKLK